MSIDLLLSPVRPTRITTLLPKVSAVLVKLLDLTASPSLTLMELEDGTQRRPTTDEVGKDASPLLVIGIAGEMEFATLIGDSDHITVSAGGRRSHLEFALTAAVAIALARELDAEVWDDRKFFGEDTLTTPEALLERMKVKGPNDDYDVAASKITWGPSGGL
jgi:hypothetical protein